MGKNKGGGLEKLGILIAIVVSIVGIIISILSYSLAKEANEIAKMEPEIKIVNGFTCDVKTDFDVCLDENARRLEGIDKTDPHCYNYIRNTVEIKNSGKSAALPIGNNGSILIWFKIINHFKIFAVGIGEFVNGKQIEIKELLNIRENQLLQIKINSYLPKDETLKIHFYYCNDTREERDIKNITQAQAEKILNDNFEVTVWSPMSTNHSPDKLPKNGKNKGE